MPRVRAAQLVPLVLVLAAVATADLSCATGREEAGDAVASAPATKVTLKKDEAAPDWRGDYQTGDFSQWHSLQSVRGGARVVTSPRHHRRFTARFVVRPGADPIHSKGERSEARASQRQTGGFSDKERWYRWSTLFPAYADLPPSKESWNIFTQWHQTERDGCPPNIAFQADTSRVPPSIKLRIRGGRLTHCTPTGDLIFWPAELRPDHWYDFVVHVKWSSDPSVGFVEVWIDGARVVPNTHAATLYDGGGVYLKQGFYRARSELTSTVYHVGTRTGRLR